ncbi:polysaccharide deacetylase family protein [Akkermansiaceae bacterium]|nr:polysaccharide deacetylase family protein [Akkermansiaceae bacterium]MDB4423412.1 polysaccharide deacetylase family protein [bacterium]
MEEKSSRKVAVISMDVEDWYHLDYFDKSRCDQEIKNSMLDGVSVFLKILEEHQIKATFFVVGEIVQSFRHVLLKIKEAGHEIASHTYSHQRPLALSYSDFDKELKESKMILESVIGGEVNGFRAPCFSMDRDCLERVRSAGYLYDSSRIDFSHHPLYGSIDMDGFSADLKGHYYNDNFHEFEVSSLKIWNRSIPVSGGGYLRIFPWIVMKHLLKRYLKDADFYVLYIHPFELSERGCPPLPSTTSALSRQRFNYGRASVPKKLSKLINLLGNSGFEFRTFRDFLGKTKA